MSKTFCIFEDRVSLSGAMTKPLALIFYEELLPGSQIANRLQDLGYRVHAIANGKTLVEQMRAEKPLLAILDLSTQLGMGICPIIKQAKETDDVSHIPILAFARRDQKALQEAANGAGATLVAFEDGILRQLPQLLEQLLQVD